MMAEQDTALYHVEAFEDALGPGERVLLSDDRVYEVRHHPDAVSMLYWTHDTPLDGGSDGYYAKVRTEVDGDEEAYAAFHRYGSRLEEAYDVGLVTNPRAFHALLEGDETVKREEDDFLVQYTRSGYLEPEPFGSFLLKRRDGRRLDRLRDMTLLDLEADFKALNRRNALRTVIPQKDAYDRTENRELDRLQEQDLSARPKAMKRYQFYDHHKLPGVAARHLAGTYEEAAAALHVMLGVTDAPDEELLVERPSIHTTPDAFNTMLDALSYTDRDGQIQLTDEATVLLRSALEREDRPAAVDDHLAAHYASHVQEVLDEQWLEGEAGEGRREDPGT